MNKNLGWKLILIIATLLVFVFGLIGIPQSWSRQGLAQAITDRIHLGLDLKGGTHLILQVQVNDAVNADTDRAIERLKESPSKRKINHTETMKPTVLADLKSRAVAQAIETIRNRVDKLGISEPVIQEHGLGQYQILVQLPGVDDPARVKEIMQSTAMLEIRQALNNGQPYTNEQAALEANGGVLPPNTVLLHGRSIGSNDNSERGDVVYLISRA